MSDYESKLGFLAGGGETGALIRMRDWSGSPLGPPEEWPQALKTAVGLMLGARQPVYVAWGPELISFYNDGYLPIVGSKHSGLGLPYRALWSEIWDEFQPYVEATMAGDAQHFVDLPIALAGRPGVPVGYFTFSYTALRDEHGVPVGFYCAATETTETVLAQRRQSFLFALEERLRGLGEPRAIMNAAVEQLGRYLGAERVGYSEARADDATIEFHSCYADGVAPVQGSVALDDYGSDSIARQRRGETEAVNDVDMIAGKELSVWRAIDTRAFVSVPLVRDGRFQASLYVNRREPHRWTTDEITLIEAVASRTWSAVERARAETALRASDSELRFALEAGQFGAWRYDLASGEMTTSPVCRTNYGRDADTPFTYAELRAAVHPGDQARMTAAIEKSLVTGGPYDIDYRILTTAGEERWIQVRGRPTRGPDGAMTAMAGVSIDITERKAAEERLRDSEARLRFMGGLEERLFGASDAIDAMRGAAAMLGERLGASRCAYADVDADNDRFWIRSDYLAPGIVSSVGTYNLDLFGPRAASELRAGKVLVVRDIGGELGLGDGREMFHAIGIDAIVCCPLVKDGRLAAMMAVHQDCARDWTAAEVALIRDVVERCWVHVERVGADARLRESEERLRLAVDNADVGFWDVDVVGDRLIWPPRTKAMFGISAHVSVTLQDFFDGLHPDDLAATSAAYAAAADPVLRAFYDVDYRTIGKEDGVVRWIAAKGRGVFDASGRCLRVAGTVVEITARKQAELALHELNETLERRVAAAIADREEAQEALRQAQKMEAMGQLTGGVAHDFNNLLTPIVGALDLLQRKGVGGEREQRLIAGAAQSADRAKTLVQRLLAFARRQPLRPVAVDIAGLIAGMGDLVASTTGPQIKVVVEAPDDLPSANADANQLEMALLNLAVNARDAMPDGGTLRISARKEIVGPGHRSGLRPGSFIGLSVADTGTGMDEATIARAIEPFFSTKGIGQGTGLGLSMVHGLASQLDGALTIQSRPGLGTNIELWLPVSTAAPVATETVRDAPAVPPPLGTALLVDDEELVRMSTADMLIELGYAVIEAASGEEAMRLVREGRRFDLLVTDHLMPGITGTDLAHAVRTLKPGTPVLLVSGYAENEGIASGLPRLTKPFRKDELVASLADL